MTTDTAQRIALETANHVLQLQPVDGWHFLDLAAIHAVLTYGLSEVEWLHVQRLLSDLWDVVGASAA
jgi:hypothetical protein